MRHRKSHAVRTVITEGKVTFAAYGKDRAESKYLVNQAAKGKAGIRSSRKSRKQRRRNKGK